MKGFSRLALLIVLGIWGVSLYANTPTLFDYGAPATSRSANAYRQAVAQYAAVGGRVTEAGVNPSAFNLTRGQNLSLDLPGGASVNVAIDRAWTQASDVHSLSGHVVGCGVGCPMVLTRGRDGSVFGSIRTQTQNFIVRASDADHVNIIDLSAADFPDSARLDDDHPSAETDATQGGSIAMREPEAQTQTSSKNTAKPQSKTPEIRVLLVYGPQLVKAYPGAKLQSFLSSQMAELNAAYQNSGLDVKFSEAGPEEINFTQAAGTPLTSIATMFTTDNPSDPFYTVKHERFEDKAQVAVFLLPYTGGGTCGASDYEGGYSDNQGHGADPAYFRPYLSYAVVGTSGASGYKGSCDNIGVLAHEVGHLLGAGHEQNDTDHRTAFPYAHAAIFGSTGTLMKHDGPRLSLFSSPDLTCSGQPCGNAETADNVHALKQTIPVVAAFTKTPSITLTLNRDTFDQGTLVEGACQTHGLALDTFDVVLKHNGKKVATLLAAIPLGEVGHTCLEDHNGKPVLLPSDLPVGGGYTIAVVPLDDSDLTAESAPFTVTASLPKVGMPSAKAGATSVLLATTPNAQGSAVTARFTVMQGKSTVAETDAIPGDPLGKRAVHAFISGLACQTSYTATAMANTAAGSVTSSPVSFTTPACGSAPSLGTPTVSAVKPHQAHIAASVAGGQAVTDSEVDYGQSQTYGFNASAASSDNGTLSFDLSDLACGTSYHYRIVAFGAHDGAATPDSTFKTADCQPGTLAFEKPKISIKNTQAALTLKVDRIGGANGPVTVKYATANGTAVAGTDYNRASGTLRWADGDGKSKTITLFSLMNTDQKKDVNFNVDLSDASGGALAGKATTVTLAPQSTGGRNPPQSSNPPPRNPPPQNPPSKSGGGGGAVGLGMLLFLAGYLILLRRREKNE
jgi:hypothetical protein